MNTPETLMKIFVLFLMTLKFDKHPKSLFLILSTRSSEHLIINNWVDDNITSKCSTQK